MPTKTAVISFINQGTGKTGKPYWNIKTRDDETFWSKTGHPVPGAAKGASVEISYDVGRSGSNNIISLGAAAGAAVNGAATRARMAPEDAVGAFRTVAFAAFAQAGLVPLDAAAIRDALRKIEAGYMQATAAPTVQSSRDHHPPEDELNDDIPY